MKSPFPGMDPYLESRWGDVHTRLAVVASNQLRPKLPSDLRARVQEDLLVEAPDDERRRRIVPDVGVIDRNGRTPSASTLPVATSIAEPMVVSWEDETRLQRSVRIVDTRLGYRLVTAIEFLSPSNKADPVGRRSYFQKQQDVIDAGASLVEIDLVRRGMYVLMAPESVVPDEYRFPYRVCVTRGWRPFRAELYRLPLRERLPSIRIPLRETDADVILDLQTMVDQVYEESGYDDIDYTSELELPLTDDDAAWADEILCKAGKR